MAGDKTLVDDLQRFGDHGLSFLTVTPDDAAEKRQKDIALPRQKPGFERRAERSVEEVMAELADQITLATRRYQQEEIGSERFRTDMTALLFAAGMKASAIGDVVQQLKDGTDPDDVEGDEETKKKRHKTVEKEVAKKEKYVDKFSEDAPKLSDGQVEQRAGLWGGFPWTVYQVSKAVRASESGGSADLDWELDPGVKEHCDDCLELANNSPYTLDSIPTWPGDGDTVCNGNCHCNVNSKVNIDEQAAAADTSEEGD